MSIESDVYETFISDNLLLSLLPNGTGSIYEGIATESAPNPRIVFANISTVSVLTTDDRENLKKVTIQVSIITDDGNYDDLITHVDADMHKLGFMFDNDNEVMDAQERTKIIRYVKLREVQ